MSPIGVHQRLLCITAILLLVTPCTAEQETSIEGIVTSMLDDVRANVGALCEPRCGEVLLDPSGDTPAAQSQRIGPGMSLISYSEPFVANMLYAYGSSVIYAIIAHEYGHHLDEIPYGSRRTRELRADSLAGCALARRADPLGPTLRWMRHEHFEETVHDVFDDPKDPSEIVREYTTTHPPWLDRIAALTRGAELCGAGKRPNAVAEVLGGVNEYSPTRGEAFVFDERRTQTTRAALLPQPRLPWEGKRAREAVYTFGPRGSF